MENNRRHRPTVICPERRVPFKPSLDFDIVTAILNIWRDVERIIDFVADGKVGVIAVLLKGFKKLFAYA